MNDDEDRRYGKDKREDKLTEELAFRESRLRKIREAKAALELSTTTTALGWRLHPAFTAGGAPIRCVSASHSSNSSGPNCSLGSISRTTRYTPVYTRAGFGTG